MEILAGIIVLILIAMVFAMMFVSYPTAIMRVTLALYRHARKIEDMQKTQTAQVSEDWMREIEK